MRHTVQYQQHAVAAKGRNLSQLSHGLTGPYRTQTRMSDTRRTMTCGYGFRRTDWTVSIGLRNRKSGHSLLGL